MEDFYRKILNINPKQDNLEEIVSRTIKDYLEEMPSDIEGLCQVHSLNIKELLKTKNIKSYLVNTLNLGANYEHYFLLVDTLEENLILIDVTYAQFNSTNKKLITKNLSDFPSNILCQTNEGKKIYINLINNKYCSLNIEEISLYLNSFDITKKKNLNEIILSTSKI